MTSVSRKNPKRPWRLHKEPRTAPHSPSSPGMYLAGQKCELHVCRTLAQGLSSTQPPFSILAPGFQANSAPPVTGAEVCSGANAAWRCTLTFWSFENVGAHMSVSFSILSQNLAATGGNWAGSVLPIRAFSGFRYGFPFPSQVSRSLTQQCVCVWGGRCCFIFVFQENHENHSLCIMRPTWKNLALLNKPKQKQNKQKETL